MTTKAEITEAIRAGIARVQGTFSSLSDEQLATQVHAGDGGWTARDILCHLAGRERGYKLSFALAEGASAPAAPGGFDVNAWNRDRIAERAHQSRDDLLAEFTTVHEGLIDQIDQFSDEQLARTIPRPSGAMTLAEALRRSGGQHSINHTIEVEQALGLSGPPA